MEKEMQDTLDKRNYLIIVAVAYILFSIAEVIFQIFNEGIRGGMLARTVIMDASIIAATIAFFKHSKSILKALVGVMLGLLVVFCLENVFLYCEYPIDYFTSMTPAQLFEFVLDIIQALLIVILLANHLILAGIHDSLEGIVKANEISILLLILVFVAQIIISSLSLDKYGLLTNAFIYLQYFVAVLFVVVIEMITNDFKFIRQKKKEKLEENNKSE